ncbi:uncharacterized protein LOC130770484 [Actinidia eriantha]|uniref:uncharacterized protein LOC130770484 n=1 Tax=Actinidia eriantha TaxID=165200 RepID=UPI00258498D4|nr:uncharacterized protein LOC130770484 [Actinidia eriantha]
MTEGEYRESSKLRITEIAYLWKRNGMSFYSAVRRMFARTNCHASGQPATRLVSAHIDCCVRSIAAGIVGFGLGNERSLPSRVFFFLGMHETMLYWWRAVVKPVVDYTIFGFSKEERWVQRVAVAASFGTLWWVRLRHEVESLVLVLEVKKKLSMDIGVADFVGCGLYYLTATIGMMRASMGIMWFGVILLYRRVEENQGDSIGIEEKV